MQKVRYKTPADTGYSRSLTAQDFENLGISGQTEDVVWDQENSFVVSLKNAVASALIEALPGEFEPLEAEGDDGEPDQASESSSES